MERALENSEARNGDRVLDDSVVLAGFSQGAYAIASLVHDLALHPSAVIHLRGVVVQQGAAVHLSPADVRALGIRIALVVGDRDGAAAAMRAEAARLQRAGVDVRFESLGKSEGHFASVATGRIVGELIDWCRAR
jgi:predicted esterase